MPIESNIQPKDFRGELWGHKYKTEEDWRDMLFMKLNKGKTVMVLICGNQRNGKSYLGVNLVRSVWDRGPRSKQPMEAKEYTFYEADKALRSLVDKERYPFMVDEAGVVIDRRLWFSKINIAVSHIIATQALKNNLFIFITPFATDIDTKSRKNFDFKIEMERPGDYVAYRYVKKHREEDEKRSFYAKRIGMYHLDEDCVTKEDWQNYLDYSVPQKALILQKEIERQEIKDSQKNIDMQFGDRGYSLFSKDGGES